MNVTVVDTDILIDAARQVGDAVDLLRHYRLSHGLAIPDALIVASALTLDCEFITKNQKDYRFVDGLHLLSYPA